jgi:hypothetical protein
MAEVFVGGEMSLMSIFKCFFTFKRIDDVFIQYAQQFGLDMDG